MCEGCKRRIQYYGQNFNFEVTSITGQSLPLKSYILHASGKNTESESLSESIASLSINDSVLPDVKSTSGDSSLGNSDSHSSVNITSTPCSSRRPLNQSVDGEGKLDDGSELNTSVEKSTTPVREPNISTDNLFSPKTPVSERSFSARENFCTPKIEKFSNENISQNFYKVTARTKFVIQSVGNDLEDRLVDRVKDKVRYSHIGGMTKQIEMLKEMVHTPVEQPELFKSFGKFYHLYRLGYRLYNQLSMEVIRFVIQIQSLGP